MGLDLCQYNLRLCHCDRITNKITNIIYRDKNFIVFVTLKAMSIVKKASKSSIDKGLNTSLALDQSNHNLNNSSSKQKFSFPKASRFDLSKSMY